MTKVAIITVAGTSTRFAESLGSKQEIQKCIYHHDGKPSDTSLYKLAKPLLVNGYKIILVTGYRAKEVQQYVKSTLLDHSSNILFCYNENYHDLPSGHSMKLGIEHAIENFSDMVELIFIEGDLIVGEFTYASLQSSEKSIITVNTNPINASTSVAFYVDIDDNITFIYDSNHEEFVIDKPFKEIHNSGQIWKFTDIELVKNLMIQNDVYNVLSESTNLYFVEQYFKSVDSYDIESFVYWKNCNTIEDYKSHFK